MPVPFLVFVPRPDYYLHCAAGHPVTLWNGQGRQYLVREPIQQFQRDVFPAQCAVDQCREQADRE